MQIENQKNACILFNEITIFKILVYNIKIIDNGNGIEKEIEDKTGLTVFGEIGQKQKGEGEIVDGQSRSFLSEQIRMIRSNLQYLFTQQTTAGGKVLLFTSSTGGEGKSFVTTNIGASLALLDKRVVILGLDLRKPKIHEYLNVPSQKGMSTYLIGKTTIGDILQATTLPNVYIIPSGPIPPNPSELIANGRLEKMLEKLRQEFDFVLLDTPPLGLVTDATLMAPLADVTFYLIRHEVTPKQYLQQIKQLNDKRILGSLQLIFNAVNYKNSPDYGYGYSYGYGYGYGYYGEEKKTTLTFTENPMLEVVAIEKTGGSLTPAMRTFRDKWLSTQIKK